MGSTPSQHLEAEQQRQYVSRPTANNVPFVLQDDMGVVIALPPITVGGVKIRAPNQPPPAPVHAMWGKRVLEISDDSPASASGLVPWLDFLVGVSGEYFDKREHDVLPQHDDETPTLVKFLVYNSKTNTVRECVVGELVLGKQMLGLKLAGTWTRPKPLDICFRVLNVARQSPAMECGLEPEYDYLLGTNSPLHENGEFTSFDDIENLLLLASEGEQNGETVVDLFVYNSMQDDVRVCALTPHRKWGDEDALFGADLASGLLHRLPQTCRRSSGRKRWQKSTTGEGFITAKQWVRTPEGVGQVVEAGEHSHYLVKLDWGFGNDATVMCKFLARNVEPMRAAPS